jgi:hypothetical protein
VNELKRLLSEGATDFERRLLRAVVNERPSARQRTRMLQGIGVSSGVALWAATAQAALVSAGGKFVLGLAAASVVALGVLPLVQQRVASDAAARSVIAPALRVDSTPNVAASAAVAVPAVVEAVPEEPGAREVPSAIPDSSNELRAQIELLDAVKHAVNRRDGAEARQLLDRFDEQFPHGVLGSEARTLRRAAQKL